MTFKDILVHVDSTAVSRTRLRLALALARRFGARLSGLHVIPAPAVPPYFKPSAIERIARIYAENAREAADLAEALFLEETTNAGTAIAWECVAGEMDEMIGERARFADLLILGQFDTENPPVISAFLLPAKVVFEAATPILVVPNTGIFDDIGTHVLVTWDGSREAACAIRDAMPLLRTAKRVSLLAIDPLRQGHIRGGVNVAELVAHLGRHGVVAEAAETTSEPLGVTNTLLEQAGRLGADLLVMGAYGHSRILEFMLGGTTPDMLERTTIPVLMSR
jgi:nucleotide-binding universal stress UspA family protein